MHIGVYWRSFKTLGGGPRVATSIIDSLVRLGHDLVIFTNEYDTKLYPILLGKDIVRAGVNPLKNTVAEKIGDAVNTTFLLLKNISDVDCLFLTGMYFVTRLMKTVSDTKIVLYVHTPVCTDWTLNPILRKTSKKIETRLYHSADYVLSNSKLTKNTLKEHLKLDSEVLYPAVATDFFAYNEKKDDALILSVCRLHPKKKSELMISFFKQLQGNCKFVLAGSIEKEFEKYGEKLKQMACSDKRISVLFNPTDEEIKTLYQRAAVFWYVYPKEEFGLPVAEAMSCGTPVVALKGGGVNEIVANGKTGFLVSSEEQFLRKTSFLLGNHTARHEMGVAARKLTEENFSEKVFTKKIEAALVNVFSRHDKRLKLEHY